MKYNNMYISERPAFMETIERKDSIIINGYTLDINYEDLSLSIINLKKGGDRNMSQFIRKAKKGWEELYDKVMAKKESHEASKNEALEDVKNTLTSLADKYNVAFDVDSILLKVEENFATESKKIETVLEEVSDVEEIPDKNEIVTSEEITPVELNQNF